MVYYVHRTPRKDKPLELIRAFSKIVRWRIKIPKLTAFPTTSQKLLANILCKDVFLQCIKNQVSRNKPIKKYAKTSKSIESHWRLK